LRFDGRDVPIFVICRDKVTPLLELVGWLERHDYQRVVLVDNASTYPPLLDYFSGTVHVVRRLPDNLGPQASIWSTGVLEEFARDNYFVVTDSDVIPDPDCPGDAVDYFHWALRRFPAFVKSGFGLRIDDLPARNMLADNVRGWESKFWTRSFSSNLYEADIDTTFALYRPNSDFAIRPAIRTGRPYVARHHPWYTDSAHPTDEERYYRQHSDPRIAHWDLSGHPVPSKKRIRSIVKSRLEWRAHVLFGLRRDRTAPRRYTSRS